MKSDFFGWIWGRKRMEIYLLICVALSSIATLISLPIEREFIAFPRGKSILLSCVSLVIRYWVDLNPLSPHHSLASPPTDTNTRLIQFVIKGCDAIWRCLRFSYWDIFPGLFPHSCKNGKHSLTFVVLYHWRQAQRNWFRLIAIVSRAFAILASCAS